VDQMLKMFGLKLESGLEEIRNENEKYYEKV